MIHLLLLKNRKRCPDKVPDAVNWGNPTWDIGDAAGTVSSKRITGTSCGILVRLDITWPPLPGDDGGASPSELWYRVTESEISTVSGTPGGGGFTLATNGSEIFVQNNQWLSFMSYGTNSDAKNIDSSVSVVNLSDGGTVLDTFVGQVRD